MGNKIEERLKRIKRELENMIFGDYEEEKKDGSDIVLCGGCLNNYANGDYDKIKIKEKE